MPASAMIGSIPHIPTFCTPGTSAPIIMPMGSRASRPRTVTHRTVNQPLGCDIRSSKSRKLGTRTATICGTRLAEWNSSCPEK